MKQHSPAASIRVTSALASRLAGRAASRVFDKGEAVLFAYPLSCIPDHSASLCSPDQDAAIRWY